MKKLTPKQRAILSQLYREAFRSIYIYAMSSLHNPALAEEAVQETFIIACAKIESLLKSSNPKGWLMLAIRNVTYNIEMREWRHARYVSFCATQKEQMVQEDIILRPELLYESYLTEDEFSLLSRVAIDGYSIQEAAEQFGLSTEACKKRLQRFRKKF